MSDVLLLASTSPRRVELLRAAGIAFRQVEPGEEPVSDGSTPIQAAIESARAKALGSPGRDERSGVPVLGVDTVVEFRGAEFGKPRDRTDAARMLRLFAGHEHAVHSAHCLLDPSTGEIYEDCATSRVRCLPRSDGDIETYLDTDEWRGKAGAYGIQGAAAAFVTLTSGDLDTVIGLSIVSVQRLLRQVALAGS